MTLKELAEEIAGREKWKLSSRDGTFTLAVALSSGRKQDVHLCGFEHERVPMVRFTTRVGAAGKLDPERCRTALELNGKFPTGCLAIDAGSLIMTDTRPLATTTAESSGRAVRFLAGQADTYEKFIYKTDEH